ncbi:hypothetical protein Tco_0213865 [Tanacetum coccineum]
MKGRDDMVKRREEKRVRKYGMEVLNGEVWEFVRHLVCVEGHVLNALIGHGNSLFRRSKLKALGSIHGQETAEEAMTPIESAFSLDVNSKLECLVFYNENEMHGLTVMSKVYPLPSKRNLFCFTRAKPITFAKVKNEHGNVMASCVDAP